MDSLARGMPSAVPTTMLSSAMVMFIAFECLDIAATLVSMWLLARMVVARPAIVRSRRRSVVTDHATSTETIVSPVVDTDACELVEDGITWPEPVWGRIAA